VNYLFHSVFAERSPLFLLLQKNSIIENMPGQATAGILVECAVIAAKKL